MKWMRLLLIYPLLSLLPPRVGYRLAELAYRYDPALRKPTRVAVANGMRRALPAAQRPEQLHSMLTEYQFMMGRELLDVYHLPWLNKHSIDRWVTIRGLAQLKEPRPDGRGRILAMAHFSRPALLVTALGLKGVQLDILTQAIDESNTELDFIDRLFLRFKVWGNRRHMLGEWLTVSDNPRGLYERLKNGRTLVVLFDIRPRANERCTVASFFGQQLLIPKSIDRLIQKTGAALYYGAIRDEGWNADIEIKELELQSHGVALQNVVAALESEVRINPAQWWQWNIFDYLLAGEPKSRQ